MPTNHEAYTAIVNGDGRDILVRRLIYPIVGSEDPQDLIAIDPDSGLRPWGLAYNGFLFWHDPLDTTTAHDGVTCIKTFDNLRYKRTIGEPPDSVLSKGYSDPSAISPQIGDWYIVGAAPVGDWAGHADDLAFFNGAGDWVFVTAAVGVSVYVIDEDSTYHVDSYSNWIIGIGSNALAPGSVLPSQLQGGGSHILWSVENQTTNNPPGIVDSVQYIIGPSPTGAWAGHPAKIAHAENGAWVIYTPANGWLAFDKALNEFYRFNGSAWITQGGKMQMNRTVITGSTTFSKDARCVMVDVIVIGGTGGARGQSGPGNGGTSSFGAHCSATGSTAETGTNNSTPGVGSGGDLNLSGFNGRGNTSGVGLSIPGIVVGNVWGVGAENSGSNFSAGAGASKKRILAASLAANETVTVGAGGSAGGGTAGNQGVVIVEEWILT